MAWLAASFAAPSAAPDAPAAPTAAEVVAARQASLDMSVLALASMKAAVKEGRDVETAAYPAAALAKWASALPTLFPAGTGEGEVDVPTRAKPLIWSDRAGFESKATIYAAAARRLADLAKAGDAVGFANQLNAVAAACDGCHALYKEPG